METASTGEAKNQKRAHRKFADLVVSHCNAVPPDFMFLSPSRSRAEVPEVARTVRELGPESNHCEMWNRTT